MKMLWIINWLGTIIALLMLNGQCIGIVIELELKYKDAERVLDDPLLLFSRKAYNIYVYTYWGVAKWKGK